MAEKQQALRELANPYGEHLPQCADEAQVHYSSPVVQTSSKCYDHQDENEDDDEHHHQRTIMEKMKHKAKKWRHTLTKTKHGHDQDCITPTSTSSAASGCLGENKKGEAVESPIGRDEMGAKMMWDKSVYMKEYLRNKLEPGEEDRALSEVITEAMSPRKADPRQGQETGVVEKVRRALSSLLAKEEPTGARPPQVAAISHQAASTNSYAEVEELGTRKLQACAN